MNVLRHLHNAPPTALFGILVMAGYAFVALFAPLIAPYPETAIVGTEYLPWSAEFRLGTDSLGRDMLSRLIYAARNTLGIALATTIIAFAVGCTTALFAAVMQGWVDQMVSRIIDVMMSVPMLITSLLLLTIFGTSVLNLILIIALLYATVVYRIARSVAMGVVVMDYVEAARVRGESIAWIMFREVLPNAAAPLVAEFGLRFTFVFLTISALSFLGLGVQPPLADWGAMVRENAALVTFGQFTPLLPAGAIALLTLAVNFVVDWALHAASGLKD